MTTNASFWDKAAPKYAKSKIGNMTAYEQSLGRVRSHLNPEDHVLEIGCGTGATALLLAPMVAHITATDFSAGMITQAKARLKGGENVTFQTAEPGKLQPHPGGYDVVMAFNLIHLVKEGEQLMRDVHGLLRPGGLFISKTPCLAHFNPFLRMLIPLMQLIGKAPFVSSLSIAELDGMISWDGFEIIETGAYPAKPPSRFVVARKR